MKRHTNEVSRFLDDYGNLIERIEFLKRPTLASRKMTLLVEFRNDPNTDVEGLINSLNPEYRSVVEKWDNRICIFSGWRMATIETVLQLTLDYINMRQSPLVDLETVLDPHCVGNAYVPTSS